MDNSMDQVGQARIVAGLEQQMEELRSIIERMAIGYHHNQQHSTSTAATIARDNASGEDEDEYDASIDTEEAERRFEALCRENQKLRYQLDHLKANYLKLLAYRDSLCVGIRPSAATTSNV